MMFLVALLDFSHIRLLPRTGRIEQNQDETKHYITKREKKNKYSTYDSVTGVHLDQNQGALEYLYKKVEVCMQARNR